MTQAVPTQVEVELCMRTFVPDKIQDRQREILQRARALEEDDRIQEVTLTWWARKVCAPSDGGTDELDSRCPEVVSEILALQDTDDLTLEPYIEKHEPGTDASSPVLFLPVITLLLRIDGEIKGMYPVTVRGRKYTIEDGLRALEAGELATNLE